MSRRTAEAAKAVREAWKNERELVLDGKGTRDWTPDQQRSIIERGRAYDDNGRAFEGHHMRSAEAHPECQGEPGNIQFLTRGEHAQAHGGSFQNPTNGRYDPADGTTSDFGEGPYRPCDVIELSEPVAAHAPVEGPPADEGQASSIEGEAGQDNEAGKGVPGGGEAELQQAADIPNVSHAPSAPTGDVKERAGLGQRIATRITDLKERAINFAAEHPEQVAEFVFSVGSAIAAGAKVVSSLSSGASSSDATTEHAQHPDTRDPLVSDADVNAPERNYPQERSSPIEHDVSSYTRQQNGKTVTVRAYKRGGSQD